jgi:hypothetical protein
MGDWKLPWEGLPPAPDLCGFARLDSRLGHAGLDRVYPVSGR